ncbi:TPA: hypothetical protein IUX30_001528 [Enterococcus faecalis]|uniref:hypothetical protein n=1 Tax=Enterococcus faecalis TaxID=1351 RepID=UPI00313EA778|nr:hypothetical protein [Enterococcus faecalis]HAP4792536.1 hypothetical protein [Enterococcus faecalis]
MAWLQLVHQLALPQPINALDEVGTEPFISEGVGSVPAVYQFLSVEQKSKVIFVPRSFFFEQK